MRVTGTASLIGIPELLQVLGFNHQSVKVELDNDAGAGYLVMDDGVLVDAVLENRRGMPAVLPILRGSPNGSFTLRPLGELAFEKTILIKLEMVLLQVVADLDSAIYRTFDSGACIRGNTSLLPLEQLLQVYENNQKPAVIELEADGGQYEIQVANGGIVEARFGAQYDIDLVYKAMKIEDAEYVISLPESVNSEKRAYDIASVVMEGLRQIDEQGIAAGSSEHADEVLQQLDAGELDEASRLEIARRYLPSGEVAPADIVGRLTVDPSKMVREAAISTIMSMPMDVREAVAADESTPVPLLRFFISHSKEEVVSSTAIRNPSTVAESVIDIAGEMGYAALAAMREREDLLKENALLRRALKANPKCDYNDFLDHLDKTVKPKIRKLSFDFAMTETPAAAKEPEPKVPDVVIEEPTDEKEKVPSKVGPKEIQFIARRGTLRQKLALICGNDEDVAVEIISQPGLPEPFVLQVCESTAAHPGALKYIATSSPFRRNSMVVRELLFNPKTPAAAALKLLPTVRQELLPKLADSRDVCDAVRMTARHILDKKNKHKK